MPVRPKIQTDTEYPQVHWAMVSVFLAFIVFRYLEGGERIPALGAIRLEFILGLGLSVIGVVMYLRRKPVVPIPSLTWALLLVVWIALFIPLSIAPGLSWQTFVDRVVKFMMVAILIAAFVTNPTLLRWFLAAYLLAFAKMTQEGIHGVITGSLMWENQGIMRLHGPSGSYLHPNTFAGTQLITLPFLYHLAPLVPRYWRIVLVTQAVGVLAIVMFCGSRTSYVGLFVWILVLIAQAKSRWKALASVAVCAMLATPFLPQQYLERLESVVTQQEKEGASIDTRKEILRDAWQIFLDHPIAGVGAGAFPIAREQAFGRIQDTHNLYLEVATNLGIVGLILFLGFAISMVRSLIRHSEIFARQVSELDGFAKRLNESSTLLDQIRQHTADLRWMRATSLATTSFLLIRLTNGFFGHDLYEVYWWFALGVVIALTRMEGVARTKTAALAQAAEVACAGSTEKTSDRPPRARLGYGARTQIS